MKLFGGIEAGGTKMVCTVASGPDHIVSEERFPTTTPDETIARIIAFFSRQIQQHELVGIGIGTFGPVDLDLHSPTYGYITSTPKPGWRNTDFVGPLKQALHLPVAFETDVNAAALGEYRWGSGQGCDPFLYFTIGTGIGMGGWVNGGLTHGLTHPEVGHIFLIRDPKKDPFEGVCPFHTDCWEGLASGPSMNKRWGQSAETLPIDHPAWAIEANYIAQAMVDTILFCSPKRIVLGGGVMQQEQLFPMIRNETVRLLNGYIQSRLILEKMDEFIVPPGLGNRAGMLGCIALAMEI
jgi:fructokinase